MAEIKRKKNTGEPGNPGQFGSKVKSESDVWLSGADALSDTPTETKQQWAKSSDDVELLGNLAYDNDDEVRRLVAYNTAIHYSGDARAIMAVRHLAGDQDNGVRWAVAWKTTDSSSLAALADDEDAGVRRAVANNMYASDTTLDQLGTDNDTEVRERVAGNPGTDAYTLSRLTGDAHEDVRIAAVSNPSTSTSTIEAVIDRGDFGDVIEAAIDHLPRDNTMLKYLASHDSHLPPEVRLRAERRMRH